MNNPLPPAPTPPTYTALKDFHLTTGLVKDGKAVAQIVTAADGCYDDQATAIQRAVADRTDVVLPIATDASPAAAVPIADNLILLGNRSTNAVISELYNRFYTLLDLRYPGPGGHVLRSLHNPFGNGYNVIFAGGSDVAGVSAAVDSFIAALSTCTLESGSLCLDRLMTIRLGTGVVLPDDVRDMKIWDASAVFQSMGYFGWNSISKRMAMYYMTGDDRHAREAIRLAFPDDRAKAEITETDDELIEDKDAPLSGPYHYGAHMMVLFWDLIEESPVFTDTERLRVTNALARQLSHPQELYWRRPIYEWLAGSGTVPSDPPSHIGHRHTEWSVVSLLCLARYFERDYPDPLWRRCLDGVKWWFTALRQYTWIEASLTPLAIYPTCLAPLLTYLLLSGERGPVRNGVLAQMLHGHDILASGRTPDWSVESAAINYLHQAAYLMQDGRYLAYRDAAAVDLDGFRLGQSFWPEPHLQPGIPAQLVRDWQILLLPETMWRNGRLDCPERWFAVASFRSEIGAGGDFILIKGCEGDSEREFHTLNLSELRLAGETLLEGDGNQLRIRSNGMVPPRASAGAILHRAAVLGGTAVVAAEVPDAPYCSWRRTLIQRVGQYALIVDDLHFREASSNLDIEFQWQGDGIWCPVRRDTGRLGPNAEPRCQHAAYDGAIHIESGHSQFELCLSDAVATAVSRNAATKTWAGRLCAGDRLVFFSLISETSAEAATRPICARFCDNAAALSLPAPAFVTAGDCDGVAGEIVLVSADHLHAVSASAVDVGVELFRAGSPVDIDWDFDSGCIVVDCPRRTDLHLSIAEPKTLLVDGRRRRRLTHAGGQVKLRIAAGRHSISGARPPVDVRDRLRRRLESRLDQGLAQRERTEQKPPLFPNVPQLSQIFKLDAGAPVTDLTVAATDHGIRVFAAAGRTIHVLTPGGRSLRTLHADGGVRVLRWWPEHALLLAGCDDEKLIAFDIATSRRRWVWVSEMDPAVRRAGKKYWFKSAPRHSGIHGLHTGVFLDGETQAFVGSACTVEILNGAGELIRRLPVFWGPGTGFVLVDRCDRSIDLLIARQPADTHALIAINNRAPYEPDMLSPEPAAFNDVPPGVSDVSRWGAMVRNHLLYEDLDGDGQCELVSDVNGAWNRVSVWAGDGTPLHNVQFGPGRNPPFRNIRGLDLADLDSDGQKEFIVALASDMVVALDNRCSHLWTRRLPVTPAVMRCVAADGAHKVYVGCEDGTTVVLDGSGKIVQMTHVPGRPTCIATAGDIMVLGTDSGAVVGVAGDR